MRTKINEWKSQYCPYQQDIYILCGDWCSLFSEPGERMALRLCDGPVRVSMSSTKGHEQRKISRVKTPKARGRQ